MRTYREMDARSERRIRKNRIRRQREMRKNILMFLMTICLIVTCSISLNGFRSNAKDDSVKTSYKYYKSITVERNDTLWSIAEEYNDKEHYDSIKDYIKEVMRINSMSDEEIHYGDSLIIPYYDENFVG
jgi:nucleoid-associated protein YgaU